MTEPDRDHQLEALHHQLKHWQNNLAARVANEAQALDLEIQKLHFHELGEVQQVLRRAHDSILQGCDLIRGLRRRLQDSL